MSPILPIRPTEMYGNGRSDNAAYVTKTSPACNFNDNGNTIPTNISSKVKEIINNEKELIETTPSPPAEDNLTRTPELSNTTCKTIPVQTTRYG